MFKLLIVAGLLAGLWAVVLLRASQREAEAEAAFPPRGEILEVMGHKVHARVFEPEATDAPDLVLIHGSGGNIRDWTASIAPALARDYRVILIDRPGHGFTDRINDAGASLEDQARLLAATAGALGAETPLVAGHSFGGAVALAWAVYLPDRIAGLTLISSPSHEWDTGTPTFYQLTGHPLTAPVINPALAAFVPETRVESSVAGVFAPDPVPSGYLEEFGAALTLRRTSLRANAQQRRHVLGWIEAMIPRYPELDMPIESVHGTADDTVGLAIHAEKLARDAPTAQLTPLDGTGHMPHHAEPQAVIDAIHRTATRAGLR